MTGKEIIVKFLENIKPSIENIDGGCGDCINEFCDNVNDELKEYNIKLECSEDYPVRISIKQ